MNELTVENRESGEFQDCSRNIKFLFLEAGTSRRTDEMVLKALRGEPIGENEYCL